MAGRKYKQLLIQPYGYWLWAFSDWEDYQAACSKKTGKPFEEGRKPLGRTQLLTLDQHRLIVIYAHDEATLAHELMHAIMMIFEEIKSDPREGNGEPAAYLMSHIWTELLGQRRFKV